MQRVEIDFCHPQERSEIFTLSWTLTGHEPSFIWFKLFCQNLKSDKVFFNRFTGFTNGMVGHDEIMNRLNQAIDVINSDGRYHIPERSTVFNQEFSNAIHHHFEILVGSYENPTEYVTGSSAEVNRAVQALNFLIHDLEAYTRNLESPENAFAGVINEVYECDRFQIPPEFNKYFSMEIGDGDLVAHYSQVGKTWIEAFYDKDQEIFPAAIRPLYAFSGEFDLMFGKLDLNEKFYKDFHAFLGSHGKDPGDQSLRLGHLPLAKLHNPEKLTIPDFKQKLAYFNDIASIRAYNADKVVAKKDFSSPYIPLFK